MSDTEAKNDKDSNDKGVGPTRSFDSSVKGPGGQIGPFRIEKELGRGGAGVVYLAHDTKLDRSVAIKSLPAELMENPKARTRFAREARVLASLNHPNIATIYEELEEAEGVGYLILEYVPGQTLAERIVRGPKIKLGEALSISLQIAEAVAAAHEHDVIHRDLKPGNIKITPEGKVKVLDFGLAKAVGGEAPDQQSTVTEPGRVIGTPAYMSPEQARGKPADKRSDIWSFGCVLYEMMTGKVPFEGETVSDTLAGILEHEPDWHALPQALSANIQVLLRRCLEKNPRSRLQHIGDARIEISETLNLPATAPPVTISSAVVPRPAGLRRLMVWAAACLLLGAIATSIVLKSFAPPTLSERGPAPTHRLVIKLPENQVLGFFHATTYGLRQRAFALSPDGSRLVYVARVGETTQLFERLMNQFEVSPVPGTEDAFSPFFSPDGQSVGYFSKDKLKIVSLLGGEPVTICDARNPQAGSWGSDDMIYFEAMGLWRVQAAGGNVERLGTESEPLAGGYPQVLPGGKAVLVSSGAGAVFFSLETMQKKVLVQDVRYARYVPTGHLVYVRAGAIETVPFSLATIQVTGPRVIVVEKVLSDSLYGSAQFAFSNDGLLVYVPGGDTAVSTPVWVDGQGNVEPIDMPAQNYGTPKLSPDGKKLAIVVEELRSNVYVYDVAKGMGTRLTLEGNNYYPLWTPDGERVVFSRSREPDEQWDLLWAPADGSGKTELLHSSQHTLAPYSWSADGKILAFVEVHPTSWRNIWVLQLEGDVEPELIVGTEYNENFPAFSPDGRWIAYMSNRDGRSQVYVRPYPAMDRIWQISDDFGEEPIWSPNGDELFYRSVNKWMVVSISTEPEFAAGTPQVVFEGPYVNVGGLSYDVAPDGQRFLVLQPEYDDSQVKELHVVTNWFEELKRLVPTGKD